MYPALSFPFLDEEYDAFEDKRIIDVDPNPTHQSALSRSKIFKEYAPNVFSWVRTQLYGVSSREYIASMEGDSENIEEAYASQVRGFSEAKGGGFFFFSADRKYLIKTMDREEHRTLLRILQPYTEYLLSAEGRHSLVMRVLGCYSIRMYGVKKYFFVFQNLFDPSVAPSPMHEVYDLKGSWVDRHVGPPRTASEKRKRARGLHTRKDTDWPASRYLRLSDEKKATLLRQVQRDARFLCRLNIMDYSVLLGIHIVEEERSAAMVERGDRPPNSFSAQSFEGPGSYQLGIIDPLQRWNWRKRLERLAKILTKCRCSEDLRSGMSAIEPAAYARRFHEKFGTEQLKMSLRDVRRDWEEEEERERELEQERERARGKLH
jgi:1-phosphatidylinositol-4-phosphate 5-kinase